MFVPRSIPSRNKQINLVQGSPSQRGFKSGYMSFVTDSRMPISALADLTNATLDQDNLPRPRESLVLFGGQPLGTMLGVSTFVKIVSGVAEKWDISMQVIGGVGKVCIRKDGGTWVAVTDSENSYSATAMTNLCQAGKRVYISNGVDAMSYYDIDNVTVNGYIVKYVSLSTPSKPTGVQTGMAGTDFTYYYRITANNSVGESAASLVETVQTNTIRQSSTWSTASKFVTLTWSTSGVGVTYNVYIGTESGNEKYLTTVSGLTYKDDGQFSPNVFKIAPDGNSTAGPKLTTMMSKDGTLYGVGDTDNPENLWYDGGDTSVGNFSPFAGGGYVAINYGGDTTPQAVKSFRTGKGDPAVTVLSRGIGGTGKMHHVVFIPSSFDGYAFTIPNVQEANGQAGTVSASAVVEINNSLFYPTGQDFKSTGTSANIQNILSTNSISNDIIPDVRMLTLSAMKNAQGLVFENKICWALPVSSQTNNQIWVKDISRGGIWIMPWIISAKFMWLSENNTTGKISFCIYDGTNILEFSRSVYTQDNGVAFNTRVAHEGLVWGDSGMSMGAIQNQRFKLLQPSGTINVMAQGLDEDGAINTLATESFTQMSSFTDWGEYLYSDWDSGYSIDSGPINFTSTQVKVINLEIDETLNQLAWEIKTDKKDCDYFLSSVLTTGIEIARSYYGD